MAGGGGMQVGGLEQHADLLALLFSLLGGFFMGAYPVPIKAPSVVKVDPHPVIFQFYKSLWVFVTGWFFVMARWWTSMSPVYIFSWWGIVSAMGWIPSGLCTISAVPRLGVGMSVAVTTSTASVLSFLVFWLVLGEKMKTHDVLGHQIYFAPVYLICIIMGSAGLVYVTRSSRSGNGAGNKQTSVGLLLAFLAGGFSAVQYGAVNLGRRASMRAIGCDEDPRECPEEFLEEFNNFGSWMASFGVGAMLVTMLTVAGAYFKFYWQGRETVDKPSNRPKLHLKSLALPGSAAGLLWCSGNFFQTAAVVRGGNAVMLPANQAIQLVTAGAFGLLYYREVPNLRSAILWCLCALWTLGFILVLSQEKS